MFFEDTSPKNKKLVILSFINLSVIPFALLGWDGLILLYILIFPFYHLFNISKDNALISVPILAAMNAVFTVVTQVILNILSLPVTPTSSYLVSLLFSTALLLLMLSSKSPTKIRLPSISISSAAPIYLMLFFALLSRIGSVIEAPVPLVHDPEAHAFWAKSIMTKDAIDYFYSPGLHIWSAFISELVGINIARVVLLLTNLLSSLIVLFWGIAAYVITRNKISGMFTSFFVLIAPLPAILFFTAGKNALIATMPVLALVIIWLWTYRKSRTTTSLILLVLSVLGVGFIHYPTVFFVILFLTFVLFFDFANQLFDGKKFIAASKRSLVFALTLIVSVLIILSVFIYSSSKKSDAQYVSDSTAAKTFHASSIDNVGEIESQTLSTPRKIDGIFNKPVNAWGYFTSSFSQSLTYKSGLIGVGIAALTSASLYYGLNIGFTKRDKLNNSPYALATILVTSLLFALLGLRFLKLQEIGVVVDAGESIFYLFASLSLGMLFTKLTKVSFIVIFMMLLPVAGIFSLSTYSAYSDRAKKSFVNSDDVAAYQWIDRNVGDNEGFLGMSTVNSRRMQIVYPIDGSTWLPVFTDNHIATPFEEQGFNKISSHINHKYSALFSETDPARKQIATNYFKKQGFRYIYIDGATSQERFMLSGLLEEGCADVVYSNNSVKIVKLR